MSAIAGAFFLDGRDMADATLSTMADAAMRRGFDGIQRWHGGPAGFIRFAHATTPEAVGEVQPFVGAASGAVLCFDGRLDNRAELLATLGMRGGRDGEIALALFDRLGDDFVKALAGDFAIAIWSPGARRMLLARSAFGWRPLLWTRHGTTFAFATEPRTLIAGLGLSPRLNEGAVGEFLAARFISQTDTFWEGVQRVPQGACLAITPEGLREWHWHDGPFEDLSDLSADDHVARFSALFDQALIASTRSTTPVGAHLSGGLDSSSVFARATELHRAGRIAQPIHALSARFPGESQDETEWSSAVEAHLGITARVTARQPFDVDAARAWVGQSLQLPIRPNVLDTTANAINRLHDEGERVLLTGEGGDEWLDGNYAHWVDLARGGRWGKLLRQAQAEWPTAPLPLALLRAARLGFGPLLAPAQRAQLLRPHIGFSLATPSWLRPEWAERIGLADRWRADALPVDLPSYAQRNRYGVFRMARRHVNLDNVMALAENRGVELRHPLHDLRLAHFSMGAAGNVLRKDGVKKYVLREAMRGTLPEKVRTRTSKARFLAHMIDANTEMFRVRPPETLLPVKLGWVDGDEVTRIQQAYAAWRARGLTGPAPACAFNALWLTLAMDMWLEQAFRL